MSRLRLVLLLLLFAGLTAAGAAWAIHRSGLQTADLGVWEQLPTSALLGLAAAAVGVYVSDYWRLLAFGYVLGVKIPRRAGFDAVVANFFFSWVTPGAAFGAPAAIYMLGRKGVPWDAAGLIAYGKSSTGSMLLMLAAFAFLACGKGPRGLDPTFTGILLGGTGAIAVALLLLVVGAARPEATLAWGTRLRLWLEGRWLLRSAGAQRVLTATARGCRSAVTRLAHFRHSGARGCALLVLCHVPYFACFVGAGVVLALAMGADPLPAVAHSTVFLAFLYVAPTPGGSGIGEATATAFFGGLLEPSLAVVLVLAWRASTLYLHVFSGLVYLPLVGGLDVVRQDRAQPQAGELGDP